MTLAFRILYRFYRVYAWTGVWAQRRFTKAGLVLLGSLSIAAVMGIDTEHNMEYQVFTLVFFVLAIAVAFSFSFRARFKAARSLPRFGTVGQPLSYTVELTNLSNRRQTGLTLLEMLGGTTPTYREWFVSQMSNERHTRSFKFEQHARTRPFAPARLTEGIAPPLPSRQETAVPMQVVPLRRGVLRFDGLIVARPDPLGLFRAFSRVKLPQTILVLPKRYPIPAIALPGSHKYQEGGVAMASNVGQSDEFVALRDYRHGDPLRHIHWRSWARAGKPVVKEFEDEFFVRHALILDTFTEFDRSELFEEAVAVAASFACTIQTQESLLDLLFVGPESYCFTAGRGLAHADQMLEILAAVSASEKEFSTLEGLVLRHAQAVSGCICVFLAWDKPRQEFVRKLRMLQVPLLVLVLVPRCGTAPEPGVMADEREHFHVLQCGAIEQGLAALAS